MMKGGYCLAVSLLLFVGVSGDRALSQGKNAPRQIWTDAGMASRELQKPQISQYRVIQLDAAALEEALAAIPMEGSAGLNASPTTLAIPLPDGTMSRFRIVASPIMAPELALRYPEIRTFSGQGTDDRTATLRCDLTPAGFHAMILSAAGTIYVDPAGDKNSRIYIIYDKKNYGQLPGRRFEEIGIQDPNGTMAQEIARLVGQGMPDRIGEQLRTYRLALACTGEYATFHGGTVSGALAAMVTAMNRVNGVYERELAIRMVLIANNDQIIYTDATTDPYTNNDGEVMLDQNQSNLDNVIGSANYDIGHVFSTGGGGIAGLGVVCRAGQKAWGVTGLTQPIGDPFYIDYVAHEMGHEFGANHPFNSVTSSCGGGNRNGSTAYEPGSGSTIMAYAGICGGDDLQGNSDDYFHVISIDEIIAYTTAGSGNSCAVITSTGNSAPVVTVGASGTTIPKGTPFFLNGSATDSDNDPLTFTWEEFDLGPAGSPNAPSGNAPIFRSFPGSASSSRTFPRLANILSNTQTIGEVLPTYARNLSFRLTARDNRANGGGVGRSATITIGVNAATGPFAITLPDNGGSWLSNSVDTVKWDVAGTNGAPINCATVNILLSTDGGNSFPTTLSAGTANDGVEAVSVPAIFSETARVKIEAVGNIFFDISSTNFAIASVASPVPTSPPTGTILQSNQVQVRWRSVAAATGYYLQLASNANFASPLVNDSTLIDTSRAVTGLTNNGTYYWRIKTRSPGGTSGWSTVSNFRVILPPAAPALSAPANGAIDQSSTVILRWNVIFGATGFHAQVATDSSMTARVLDDSAVTTTQRTASLNSGQRYYWRVRARNNGGWGAFSAVWTFTTTTTSVDEQPVLPREYFLSQNFPNPFNPETRIAFAIPLDGFVTLEVYNLLGQRVAILQNGDLRAGYHVALFNGADFASGMYFYRMRAVGNDGRPFVHTRSLVIMK
jgi:hypothetical protein